MSLPADKSRRRLLITPEGIAIPIVVASRGARLGALILDLFFIGLMMLVITIGLVFLAGGVAKIDQLSNSNSPAAHALEFLFVLWIVVMFLFRNAWFIYFELSPRGATPGKRISGVRIAARDGGRLSAEMVIARNLLRDIELFTPIALIMALGGADGDAGLAGLLAAGWFLIFALMPLFNRDRLRAGDMIAGTWVVEAPKRKLEAVMSSAKPEENYAFGEAELAAYGEYELQTLERVLRDNRSESMRAVALSISQKIGWTAPGDGAERAFLQAYYTQLRARLELGMRMGARKADKFG